MKQIYLLIFLLAGFSKLNAAPVLVLQNNNGDWKTNSSWNLLRSPVSGDTLVIPAGMTVIVNDNLYPSSAPQLYIKVYGTLHFNGGGAKLNLDINSVIVLYSGGSVTSTGSESQVIVIGGERKYEGSQGTIVGPVIADRNSGAGFAYTGGVLPVRFISFVVNQQEQDIVLKWSVTQESLGEQYSIERSYDNFSWSVIATMLANGNRNATTQYSYSDKNNSARSVYYRVKHIDVQGKETYSTVRSININHSIFSAVVKASGQQINIFFPKMEDSNVDIQIVSTSGQLLYRRKLSYPYGQVAIPVTFKGNCIVSITDSKGIKYVKQISF